METTAVLTSAAALVFVLALIALVSFLLRKYGTERVSGTTNTSKKRLSVSEIKIIDGKNKLVIAKCDKTEYLLCVGTESGAVIIDTEVGSKKSATKGASKQP